jgi:hypothetical protein
MPSSPDPAITPASRFRRRPAVVSRTFEGQAVLVVVDRRMTHELNAVGTRVWALLDGRTVGEVADAVAAEFGVARDRVYQDVVGFLERLLALGAVEEGESAA